MTNVYNRFVPRAPDARTLGSRLLGDPRGVMQKVPVTKPNVPALFRNSYAARSSISQNQPYGLVTATSRGLAGLGGFGAFSGGPPLGAGGITFGFDLDRADFFGRVAHQNGLRKLKLSWTPPDGALVAAADRVLGALQSSNTNGQRLRTTLIADGQRLADRIYEVGEKTAWESPFLGARGEVDIFGKVLNDQPERQRIEAMEDLKDWLERVAATNLAQYARVTVPNPSTTPGSGLQSENQGSAYGGGGSTTPTGGSSMADRLAPLLNSQPMPSAAPTSSKLPYIIGGVALVGVGAFLFLRKK
jgi:hypothetical protein